MTDIVIKLRDDTNIKVHSAVVCSQSDFFRTKVTSWLDQRESRTIDLTGHPSANVVSVIEFMYGAQLNITNDNLVEMADYRQKLWRELKVA